ncbi:MAG: hypothetical protein WDZ85_02315 [Candidatus Paceibacterota bacterium]
MTKQDKEIIDSKAGVIIRAGLISAVVGGLMLYGPKGEKNRRLIKTWAIKAKADLIDEVEKMKNVSEDRYHLAIGRVIRKYGRMKNVSEAEAVKLGRELRRHWQSVISEVGKNKK